MTAPKLVPGFPTNLRWGLPNRSTDRSADREGAQKLEVEKTRGSARRWRSELGFGPYLVILAAMLAPHLWRAAGRSGQVGA